MKEENILLNRARCEAASRVPLCTCTRYCFNKSGRCETACTCKVCNKVGRCSCTGDKRCADCVKHKPEVEALEVL